LFWDDPPDEITPPGEISMAEGDLKPPP